MDSVVARELTTFHNRSLKSWARGIWHESEAEDGEYSNSEVYELEGEDNEYSDSLVESPEAYELWISEIQIEKAKEDKDEDKDNNSDSDSGSEFSDEEFRM